MGAPNAPRCPPKGRGLAVAGERRGAADTCAAARHQREPTGDPRHLGRVPEGVALSEIEQHARSPCRSGVGRKLHPLGRRALGIDQDGGVPREIAIRKRSMVAHSRDAAVADGIDDERFDAFSGSPPAPTTRILYRSCRGGPPSLVLRCRGHCVPCEDSSPRALAGGRVPTSDRKASSLGRSPQSCFFIVMRITP